MKCTKKHDARAKLLFFQPFFVVLVAVAVVVALAPSYWDRRRQRKCHIKVNLLSFNFHRDYSNSITWSNVGELSGVEFLRTIPRIQIEFLGIELKSSRTKKILPP